MEGRIPFRKHNFDYHHRSMSFIPIGTSEKAITSPLLLRYIIITSAHHSIPSPTSNTPYQQQKGL